MVFPKSLELRALMPMCSAALTDLTIRTKPLLSTTAGASPFAGGPDNEVDLAWHNLLGNTTIRASQEELNRNGNHRESVALPENGGHLVWLGVFHQLHCLVSCAVACGPRRREAHSRPCKEKAPPDELSRLLLS